MADAKAATDKLSGSKWHAAAAASLKSGPHKTMFNTTRVRVQNVAVSSDTYHSKGSYAGDWADDKREGYGVQTFSSGDK